ncbi:MAG TPA: 6-bladed beta-propeller [Gemmatimonas sp.]|uniref:6-bladed beta-propeller n=1 Tax=Gemmatimonas sp. TaxID=1962908 RepID=UPI002ED8F1F5
MSINSTSRQCLLLCTGVAVAAALGCAPAESERDASAAPSGASGDTAAVVTLTWATAIDSTRDTVVVRTDSVSDAETAVRLVEELRIGDANDDDPRVLGEIRFVVPTPRGGVYVWDQSATQLREYDDRGRFARDIGRSGAGPGEYRSANGIMPLSGGRLVLWDPQNLRMALFDSTGHSLGHWGHHNTLGVARPGGLLVDSTDAIYVVTWFRKEPKPKDYYNGKYEGYVVLSADGAVRDSIQRPYWLPEPALVISRFSVGAMIGDNVPFAAQPRWTVSPFGYVVSGVGNRYAITLHRPDRPLRIERDVSPVPTTPQERTASEAAVTANMRTVNPQWTWNGLPIPRVKAFFSDIRVAADGRIWVERPVAGAPVEYDSAAVSPDIVPPIGAGPAPGTREKREQLAFDVFSRDGYLLGSVQPPPESRITFMRGDYVWGVVSDDMGRSVVVRWRIEPSLAARERGHRAKATMASPIASARLNTH